MIGPLFPITHQLACLGNNASLPRASQILHLISPAAHFNHPHHLHRPCDWKHHTEVMFRRGAPYLAINVDFWLQAGLLVRQFPLSQGATLREWTASEPLEANGQELGHWCTCLWGDSGWSTDSSYNNTGNQLTSKKKNQEIILKKTFHCERFELGSC